MMEVEDHPIEYNKFEGTIPKGVRRRHGDALGPGHVRPGGRWWSDALREGYERGDPVCIERQAANGGWVLVRMRRDDRDRAQWLLIKHRDETSRSDYDVVAEVNTSVATGRTMDEITEGAPENERRKIGGEGNVDNEVILRMTHVAVIVVTNRRAERVGAACRRTLLSPDRSFARARDPDRSRLFLHRVARIR
jgi:hypothetical protein